MLRVTVTNVVLVLHELKVESQCEQCWVQVDNMQLLLT